MRTEHRMIGDCLEAIHHKVQAQDPESDQDDPAAVGYPEIAQHEGRTDSLPVDRSGDQRSGTRGVCTQAMKEIPEERYRTCCGSGHS
jgi:regulator of cell morphogenesis and NO signaling